MDAYRRATSADAVGALGDPTRRVVFERLRERPQAVGELAAGLPVSRPAVSQHLRILKDAGLVSERREGTRHIYAIAPEGVAALRDYFEEFWTKALAGFKAVAEEEKGAEMSTGTIDPVRVATVVSVPPERAWEAFTAELQRWWPVETHSVLADRDARPERVVVEPHAGGEIYEQAGDERHHWGTILAWEPPHRLTVEWRVNPSRPATEFTVMFTAEDGRTRVELVHRGWEALGDDADEARVSYGGDGGWTAVLGRYEQYLNG